MFWLTVSRGCEARDPTLCLLEVHKHGSISIWAFEEEKWRTWWNLLFSLTTGTDFITDRERAIQANKQRDTKRGHRERRKTFIISEILTQSMWDWPWRLSGVWVGRRSSLGSFISGWAQKLENVNYYYYY